MTPVDARRVGGVHAQPTKVTDHEATVFVGCCERVTRNGILRVYFESDAVF